MEAIRARAQKEPQETSWLVQMQYIHDGQAISYHCYLPNRFRIYALLHEIQGKGKETHFPVGPHPKMPDWMNKLFEEKLK